MRYIKHGLVLALLLASVPLATACSFSRGYFYQVTRLRGRVVGKDLKFFPPLQYMRWMRQSFSVAGARLTLFEFRNPITRREDMPELSSVQADESGRFDFGNRRPGHYTLIVERGNLVGWFDVEVKTQVPETDSVLIDISPVFPDCKGGHEFIVRDKR